MYNIAIMGDQESVMGFKSLGIKAFPVVEEQEMIDTFKKLTHEDYGIIYMTEYVFSKLEKYVDEYSESILPAIIPIPGVTGNTGEGIKNVKKSVEQAVGSDIIFGND